MKKVFIALGISMFIFSSCDYNQKPKSKYMTDYEYKKHRNLILDSLTSRTDTVFLDFIMGMPKRSYNKHLSNLIKTKKIGVKKELKINLGDKNYKAEGNSYDFYLSSRKYNSIISSVFYQNKLKSIEVLMYNIDSYTEDMLIDVFKKKYGVFLREEPTGGGMVYYWIINNLEIKIQRFIQQHLIFITYSNLITQRAIEEKERIKKEKIQNKNKEKAADTHDDI